MIDIIMAEQDSLKNTLVSLQKSLATAQDIFNQNQKLLDDRNSEVAQRHADLQKILDQLKTTQTMQQEYLAKTAELTNNNDK